MMHLKLKQHFSHYCTLTLTVTYTYTVITKDVYTNEEDIAKET